MNNYKFELIVVVLIVLCSGEPDVLDGVTYWLMGESDEFTEVCKHNE